MTWKPAVALTAAVMAVVASIAFAAAPGGAAAPAAPATPAAGGAAGAGAGAGGGRAGRGGGGGGAAAQPLPVEDPVILPKSIPADGKPQINGPLVTGSNLGHLFLYRIPATGDAPLTYAVDNLPAGLTLDAAKGVITGTLKTAQATAVTIHAKNAKGEATRPFVIVGGGHEMALTPPLGWNSWNCWGLTVSDARVRAAADGFDQSGLAAHGFQYVNIDDGWEIRGSGADTRDAQGNILVNTKFPDMKALGQYIHDKGLKFGIYSGPGPTTCGGYCASWQHEEQDAHSWASWGVDYIKYDWCSYTNVAPGGRGGANSPLPVLKLPYQVLRQALDKQDRDITMSLCQYGWGNVWEWGAEDGINGNLWRATGDITDTWASMTGIGFAQNGHEQFAGAGHWNDVDMLVVGKVGWGNTPRANRMTQNEQLTHITLWSVLAAPMLLGCDLTQLDEFTTDLMSNDEVLAVNQDPAGKQGWRIASMDADDMPVAAPAPPTPASAPATATAPGRGGRGRGTPPDPRTRAPKQIWARPLADGTYAVGLFNLGNDPAKVTISMKDLATGLKTTFAGPQPVRDVWQLKNLDPATDTVSATVLRHSAVLLKVGTPKPQAAVIADIVKANAPK